MAEVFLTSGPGEVRGALVKEHILKEFYLSRSSQPSWRDAICCGRVVNHLPHLKMVVVNCKAFNAFLQYPPNQKLPVMGEKLLLQVLAHGFEEEWQDHALLKATTQVTLANSYFVYTPYRQEVIVSSRTKKSLPPLDYSPRANLVLSKGMGGILRQEGITCSEEVFTQALDKLLLQWQAIEEKFKTSEQPEILWQPEEVLRWLREIPFLEKVQVDSPALLFSLREFQQKEGKEFSLIYSQGLKGFPEEIEEEWENLSLSKIALPSGGTIIIEQTTAAIVIDVNTNAQANLGEMERAHLQTNLEAVEAIFYQGHLRNLQGLILVDFIPLKRLDFKKKLESKIKTFLEDCPSFHFHGLSKRGLGEFTRENVFPPLLPRLFKKPTVEKTSLTVAYELLRAYQRLKKAASVCAFVHPEVAQLFKTTLKKDVEQMESQLKIPFVFKVKPDLERENFYFSSC